MDQFGGITGEEAMRNAERNFAVLREAMVNPQPAVSGVDELVAFLRAALDRDEQVAREAAGGDGAWSVQTYDLGTEVWIRQTDGFSLITAEGGLDRDSAEHVARWDPARVLAEVQAKRRILDLRVAAAAQPIAPGSAPARAERTRAREALEAVARLLAQPHAGQPGWRDEWQLSAPA